MSKSLGNYLTIEDLRKQNIDGNVIRFVLLSTHYRQPLDWTNRKVSEANNILSKWLTVLNDSSIEIHGKPPKKILEALNLNKNEYFPVKKIDLKIDKIKLLELINRNDKYGKYAWSVISKIIFYSS